MPTNDMRGLWRGNRVDNSEWVEGYLSKGRNAKEKPAFLKYCIDREETGLMMSYIVDPSTLGECTGLCDKNGKLIFEGDIVQYNAFDDFACQSVVKIGRYKQDGSDGEYNPKECYGVFVEVDNFTCSDWAVPDYFLKYLIQQNLLEVANVCEIIGNIHDNPELLKGVDDNGSRG